MFFRARGGGAVGLEAVVYIEEGGRLYHPSMMLKVSLYGYGLGMNEFAAVGACLLYTSRCV